MRLTSRPIPALAKCGGAPVTTGHQEPLPCEVLPDGGRLVWEDVDGRTQRWGAMCRPLGWFCFFFVCCFLFFGLFVGWFVVFLVGWLVGFLCLFFFSIPDSPIYQRFLMGFIFNNLPQRQPLEAPACSCFSPTQISNF